MTAKTLKIALITTLATLASATPALASYQSWAGSAPIDTLVTFASDDDASTDGIGRPGGIDSVEDGAGTDAPSFTWSSEDDAPSFTWSSEDDASTDGIGKPGGISSAGEDASDPASFTDTYDTPNGQLNAI